MTITHLAINRLEDLRFVSLPHLVFSFISSSGESRYDFVLFDEAGQEIDREKVSLAETTAFRPHYSFEKARDYAWEIQGKEEHSERYFFRTEGDFNPLILQAPSSIANPIFRKAFSLPYRVKKAYLSISGLGLYVAFLNGKKVGDLFLTPGFNDYDDRVFYQTYDISDALKKDNEIRILIGDGWYRGRIGFDGHPGKVWGDDALCALKLEILDEEGVKHEFTSDASWEVSASPLKSSSIYDGEVLDFTQSEHFVPVEVSPKHLNFTLQDGAFVKEVGRREAKLIRTPKGESVLDFGQNFAGFVSFSLDEPKGKQVSLAFGEVLQNGEFYRDNLRSAKAELLVTSDGTKRLVRTDFTYFGFRYVLLKGFSSVKAIDFVGIVLSSCLEDASSFSCSDGEIEQLVINTKWGQRSNFLSIPSDCPQRDERMGWTADTQVFAKTAMMNADCFAFYQKYIADMAYDQKTYYGGNIPAYSPSLKGSAFPGGAVWADAITLLPSDLYLFYGDQALLAAHLPLMEKYCDVLLKQDEEQGNEHWIKRGFTFGDWLALDGADPQALKGGTEDCYIQSIYYYVSLEKTAEAAKILKRKENTHYFALAHKAKQAILHEFFTPSGRLAIDTQTGYVLALTYGIYRSKEKLIEGFKTRLKKDNNTLKTGFAGTPLLLNALFAAGLDEEAFQILLNPGFPGWIYQIRLGATTIWERWNSLLPDGSISGTGMNSLNHYANGSVCYAIYSALAGLSPLEAGFKKVRIEPHLNHHFKLLSFSYLSPRGEFKIAYKTAPDRSIEFTLIIPKGTQASVKLPEQKERLLQGGDYHFSYPLKQDLYHPYSIDTPFARLYACPQALAVLAHYDPERRLSPALRASSETPREILHFLLAPLKEGVLDELDHALRQVED